MLLKLQNIGKIYNSNDILTIGIRNINLEFDYNEFVTIEGQSGSGKSTLLNVIAANDTYEEGELFFKDLETSHYSESEWEKYREENIAMIFQDFNIIDNLTVLENVELALLRITDKKLRRKRALELIEKVGLTSHQNQRSSKLSGGEKQRTVIARALAKDSPIILADEPTGNLDVKASEEVAKLLHDLAKDKLVIVVTHNPEYFVKYATRRVHIYDGGLESDEVITKPDNNKLVVEEKNKELSKKETLKNIMYLGLLNYRSRPKFSIMMTSTLLCFSICLFIVLSLFNNSLISNITTSLDDIGINGKVIVSANDNEITYDDLDLLVTKTNAAFYMLNRDLSEFSVDIPKKNGLSNSYTINALFDPLTHNLKSGAAILKGKKNIESDLNIISDLLINANVGINDISIDTSLEFDGIYLYLGYDDILNYGASISAMYTKIKIGIDSATLYTFMSDSSVESGTIKLANSNYYDVDTKLATFSYKTDKSYEIVSSNDIISNAKGLVVLMNEDDYNSMFKQKDTSVQASLYFENDSIAKKAISNLPDGYIGMLSTSSVYVNDASNTFTYNILWYLALICGCLVFSVLISIIFMRSARIFKSDFAIYKTLGIKRSVSKKALYVQFILTYLPIIILLPIVALICAIIPRSTISFISLLDYLFIVFMLLIVVLVVSYLFNKSINNKTILRTLSRGSR